MSKIQINVSNRLTINLDYSEFLIIESFVFIIWFFETGDLDSSKFDFLFKTFPFLFYRFSGLLCLNLVDDQINAIDLLQNYSHPSGHTNAHYHDYETVK